MKIVKLLLVEDDPILARSIPPQMTKYGYRIAGIASTGEEGVALAARLQPDLVLMDVDLLGAMDGVAAASAIQQTRNIPILFITSHADSERTKRAKAAGPFCCLLKPLTERELAIAIELSLCRHQFGEEQRRLTTQLKEAQKLAGNGVTCSKCGGKIE